ncbi:hypothetical protein ABZ471_31090 [Streptomyces sp. NPDC005728]|uniref:hypothetical protein n=1 Tax=Streptomyces sp. NPDC005728 TaxID=3157054 RepID=UPI0033D40AE5
MTRTTDHRPIVVDADPDPAHRTAPAWAAEEATRRRLPFTGHTGPVEAVAISPDGTWLAGVSQNGEICVGNVRSRRIATLVRTDDSLTTCKWASHDRTFVAAGTRGLHLFERRT